MRTPPRALGLVFCDRLVPDPETGQVSLRGLINQFEVFDFSDWHPFTVYALLAGGSGEGRLLLEVYELGDRVDRRIYRKPAWVRFVAEPDFRNMEIRLRQMRFFKPVPHLMRLTFEGEVVSERRFRVLDGRVK